MKEEKGSSGFGRITILLFVNFLTIIKKPSYEKNTFIPSIKSFSKFKKTFLLKILTQQQT